MNVDTTEGSFLNKLVSFHEHLKEHSVKEPLLVFLYVDFMDKTRLTLILKCMIQRVQTLFFCNSFAPWSYSCSVGLLTLNESKYLQLVFRLIL